MENIKQMSMLEVAIKLMNDKRTEQPIDKIIKETLEMKGLDDPEGDLAAQLYIDITSSSCFVYMGEGAWDLKSRQSLDQWDKDGSSYSDYTEEETNEFDLNQVEIENEDTDYEDSEDNYDEDNEYDNQDEDDNYDDSEYSDDDYDDDDDEGRYIDEDSYNDIMDDYEDMYD